MLKKSVVAGVFLFMASAYVAWPLLLLSQDSATTTSGSSATTTTPATTTVPASTTTNTTGQSTTTFTPPSSGDFWNPANWAGLVEKLGVVGFMCLVMFGFFIVLLWKILTRWDAHLTRQEKLVLGQYALCRQVHQAGGVANVSDFREVGHDVANILQDLGEGISEATGKIIKEKTESMHRRLRNSPAPLPDNLAAAQDGNL